MTVYRTEVIICDADGNELSRVMKTVQQSTARAQLRLAVDFALTGAREATCGRGEDGPRMSVAARP